MQKASARFFASLAGLSAAVMMAPAAAAQSIAPMSAASVAKNDAILGGAPSRLAAIMAAQGGGSTPQFQNAALVRPSPYIALRRAPAVASDRPDVFNSVALEVGRTSLDRRWSAVAGGSVDGEAAQVATSLRDNEEYDRVDAVNRYVNAQVTFVDDSVRFGVADRWSPASQTLASGRGDCEDFAIAKRAMLRLAGFAEKDLYLVVLKDLVRRADHAVLVVRTGGRFLVLDNGTDRLVDSADIADYRPILTFTAGRAFTHGYRRNDALPPVRYAMAEVPEVPVPAASPAAPAPNADVTAMPSLEVATAYLKKLPETLAGLFRR